MKIIILGAGEVGGNLAQKTIPKQSHKKPKLFGLLLHYLKTDMNINTMVW